ncbi:hypothetical protein [Reyranella sp.]|uniref:hypothetical protein n=1 Tax=Reyranella sp. TaxID=1929291 RepID=UPI0025F573DD|nr:hypothetical protein [Reyranella sp.]
MNAEKIRAGIALTLAQMADRGWHAESCLVEPDATAAHTLERQLGTASYDCVVVGAGVRLPPKSLLLFESIINAVHRGAPNASIAFNTRPEDSADAAARRLSSLASAR